MTDRDRLLTICFNSLVSKSLRADERYLERFKKEFREIDLQGEHEYFLGVYDKFRKGNLKFPINQHNNLVDYLLDLTDQFDIDRPSAYIQGEFPDIDIDYIKEIRDHIKRVWAPKQFGQEKICEIATYGTSGVKSSALDYARIYEAEKSYLNSITTEMEDKDDEGKPLEWDKALEMYPKFKEYCEKYPEVADAARLAQDRNRSGGVHAGGLIISNCDISSFVPLEVRMVNKQNPNGVICSAWTEGLNRQDLQPVGLIKFDLLVVKNLIQISYACHLIKERYGLDGICALPGQGNFTDLSYLNDPKALAMADQGDLKGIFQFDRDGIQQVVKRGGVSSFDDLAAYSALYRPGPLNMGMDAVYCRRKRGQEPYNLHPLMHNILAPTYGVLVYQEQIMELLRMVGEVPSIHTEKVRKAISKKKIEQFIKYKEMFVKNGMKNLNANEEYVLNLWDMIESFAEYGFNKSHAYAYTYISSRLLWIKAHYPIEFYTAIMRYESEDDRLKLLKLDAERHNIKVNPVHINKSKANFSIHENEIYFGFSNIKSVGPEVSERIVEHQPYKDFADFLHRFGTDATIVKPLVAIGVFDEKQDRLTLRKFHQYYKKKIDNIKSRDKRFLDSCENHKTKLKDLIDTKVPQTDPDYSTLIQFGADSLSLAETKFDGVMAEKFYRSKGEMKVKEIPFFDLVRDLHSKYQEHLAKNEVKKLNDDKEFSIADFDPSTVTLDNEEEVALLTNEIIVNGKKCFPEAEKKSYGFQWTHILETSPDYSGNTFAKLLSEAEQGLIRSGPVDVMILEVNHKVSKSGNDYWTVVLEDSSSVVMNMNIFKDDFERFKELLVVGNMLSIQVNPPGGGFPSLTFKTVPRHERRKLPPKELDARMVVLRPQEINLEELTQEVPEEPEKKAVEFIEEKVLEQELSLNSKKAPKTTQVNSLNYDDYIFLLNSGKK